MLRDAQGNQGLAKLAVLFNFGRNPDRIRKPARLEVIRMGIFPFANDASDFLVADDDAHFAAENVEAEIEGKRFVAGAFGESKLAADGPHDFFQRADNDTAVITEVDGGA